MKSITTVLKIFLLLLETSRAFLPLQSNSPTWNNAETDRGCLFGDTLQEVGTSWHPNVGKLFGTMYCVRCDCSLTVDSDGKRRSKVSCQNMRNFCPVTECKDAKIQRGECCPTCPEPAIEAQWGAFEHDSRFVSTLNDDGDSVDKRNSKKYHAIMLNPPDELMRFVARSTFTLHRENLHFTIQIFGYRSVVQLKRLDDFRSLLICPKVSRLLQVIQIVDDNGNVLLTQEPSSGNVTPSRICGVWRNLPRSFITALEAGNLSMKVSLKTPVVNGLDRSYNDTLIDSNSHETYAVGPILSHRSFAEETFSSILRRQSDGDAKSKGGAAVIITLSKNFKHIDFVVLYRNIAPENSRKRKSNYPLYMKLELRNNNNATLRKTDVRLTNKGDEVADSWKTNADLLRLLGEGSLHITLEAREGRRGQVGRYVGNITTRTTCDLIQAVISGSNCDPPQATGAVGSAMIQINADNTISYQMIFSELKSRVRSLQFRAFYRKRTRVIADVTAQIRGNKANGVMREISARALHLLQNGESWITVTTDHHRHCEIQGNIVSILYSRDSARYKVAPIPLAGSYVSPPVSTGAGGHAWLHLDHNCSLHYEIVVSGLSKDIDSTVNAHLHGLAEISGMELTHKKLLKGFYGTEARGILREIPNELYKLMNDGTAFVQVATKRNPSGEIRGKVHITNSCVQSGIQKITSIPHVGNGRDNTQDNTQKSNENPDSCHFEGKLYRHNSQWVPDYDKSCTTCSCWRGRATCQPVSCPPTDCFYPVITESGCCPVCEDIPSTYVGPNENSYAIASLEPSDGMQRNANMDRHSRYSPIRLHQVTDGCYQDGDQILHPKGSSWNPIVAPFGRIACVSCTCHGNNEYNCERIQCPPTSCRNPKRQRPSDCCRTCEGSTSNNHRIPLNGEAGSHFPRNGWMRDGGSGRMCLFGKDLHPVGSSWKPKAFGLGEVRCIVCTCQVDENNEAVAKCKRKCPKDEE